MAGGINSVITKSYAGHVDLLNSTLEAFDKGYFAETFAYTDYPLVKLFFEEAREDNSGGNRLEWEVRLRKSGTAQWIAPYATTANTVQSVTAKAFAPWRSFQEKIHYDMLEKNMNHGKEQLVDIMMPKMSAAVESIQELLESAIAGSLGSITDTDPIYGLQYWLGPVGTVSSSNYVTATDTTGGFNGQLFRSSDGGASYTIGGLDASDVANSRWRSYCATHNGTFSSTTVEQIKRALTRTDFKTMDGAKGQTKRENSGRRAILMSHDFCDAYETILNSGPDWLNGDAAGKTDAKIRKIEVMRVPIFGDYSHQPIIGVNTKKIYGRVLMQTEGTGDNGMPVKNWMGKIPFTRDTEMMTTLTAAVIGQLQIQCDDRRGAGFNISGVIAST